MTIETIGDKTLLLASNDTEGEHTEHRILNSSIVAMLGRAGNLSLTNTHVMAIGKHLLTSSRDMATPDTAPLLEDSELPAFYAALALGAYNRDTTYAGIASRMAAQIVSESKVGWEELRRPLIPLEVMM